MITVKKFWATYCGPCKMLAPVMNEIKTKFPSVRFENIDVEEHPDVATKYSVRSVPTVVIEKNGVEVQRFTGLQSKLAYTNAINENL